MGAGEIIKAVADYGILVCIAGVFLWDKIINSNKMVQILKDLQTTQLLQAKTLDSLMQTSQNTSTALNILQNTLASLSELIIRHDKRAEYMNNDIKEIVTILKHK